MVMVKMYSCNVKVCVCYWIDVVFCVQVCGYYNGVCLFLFVSFEVSIPECCLLNMNEVLLCGCMRFTNFGVCKWR